MDIKRVEDINKETGDMIGPNDGVQTEIKGAVTIYKPNGEIENHKTTDCGLYCAYSNGTITLSIRKEYKLSLSVRLDEMIEFLKEASIVGKKYEDLELEKMYKEFLHIPLVESDSPSGLILIDDWWLFPKGADKDDILNYFDNQHSKGLHYLNSV